MYSSWKNVPLKKVFTVFAKADVKKGFPAFWVQTLDAKEYLAHLL